ncbi:hypothetical protein [Bowmanella denitrificans]|uniref:hypothetical protein n=1 Tax=Bowmanella denitrificans TaxID=366582 RepID=UPI0011AF969F|nr:hypothetical protein [Bowmanella denitrificans]
MKNPTYHLLITIVMALAAASFVVKQLMFGIGFSPANEMELFQLLVAGGVVLMMIITGAMAKGANNRNVLLIFGAGTTLEFALYYLAAYWFIFTDVRNAYAMTSMFALCYAVHLLWLRHRWAVIRLASRTCQALGIQQKWAVLSIAKHRKTRAERYLVGILTAMFCIEFTFALYIAGYGIAHHVPPTGSIMGTMDQVAAASQSPLAYLAATLPFDLYAVAMALMSVLLLAAFAYCMLRERQQPDYAAAIAHNEQDKERMLKHLERKFKK